MAKTLNKDLLILPLFHASSYLLKNSKKNNTIPHELCLLSIFKIFSPFHLFTCTACTFSVSKSQNLIISPIVNSKLYSPKILILHILILLIICTLVFLLLLYMYFFILLFFFNLLLHLHLHHLFCS